MFFKIKLRGGALYIALIVSIVIGIILSVFILIAYFNQRQVLSQLALTQLRFNLKSGLSFASSENFSEQYNNTWQPNTFNADSLRIKKLQWGSYELISVETKNRHQYLKESALYGYSASRDTAIMVADNSRPIGLSGNIKFNGSCYFPKAGIKPAYIEGESFHSEGPLESFLRSAPGAVPGLKKSFTENLKKCVNEINTKTDSIIAALPQQLTVPFSKKTAVLQSGNLSLNNYTLSGNIKVVAGDVSINKESTLFQILIVANKVRIKKGFKGSLHIIASDSIILEDECVLDYPSSLTIIGLQGANPNPAIKGIYMGLDCIINGAMLAFDENGTMPLMVKLNKSCEAYGLIYSSNYAHIQGKMFGNIYCKTLLLTTPSAVYENHMLDCELDPKKFGASIVIPPVFENKSTYKCCKWL